jgi:hypothetical protein
MGYLPQSFVYVDAYPKIKIKGTNGVVTETYRKFTIKCEAN